MKTNHLTVILALFMAGVANAQDYKFGKVTEEMIREKVHPKDSSAPAAILYKKGLTEMEYDNKWMYAHEVEASIKIYTTDGYEYATIAIPVYKGGSTDEKITNFKAYTYNLVDGKVEKEKLKSESQFTEEINDDWSVQKYTFPNVKEGSILEYHYNITSPYITSLPEWQFQYHIPVNYNEYETRIPEYFNYKEFNKGYYAVKREHETRNGKFTYRYTNSSDGTNVIGVGRTETASMDYTYEVNTYIGRDIPKLVEERYVNNIDNYLTSVKHELAWSRMPNSPIDYHNQSWESVAKSVYDYAGFGNELGKTGYFESDIDKLTASVSDPMKKAGMIFQFVKNKMVWNGTYGFTCREGVKKAYQENSGNVAELNLMLTSMLRYAGVNANPVLVSTRAHGIPLFPTTGGFNYVVCAVEIDKGLMLLDATNKYSLPGVLPERALNWFGRLVRKDGSSTSVNLMPVKASQESVSLLATLSEDGDIEGKYRKQYTEHCALSFRNQVNSTDQEEYLASIENSLGDIEIADYEITNKLELDKPVTESFSFKKESAVDIIGDKIYVNPALFLGLQENPFKLETREFPVDFSFPKSGKTIINLKLPAGYEVESLPEPSVLSMPDDLGSFKFVISEKSGMVQVMINSDIKTAIIAPQYYPSLKEFYKQMVDKQAEKLVLRRI